MSGEVQKKVLTLPLWLGEDYGRETKAGIISAHATIALHTQPLQTACHRLLWISEQRLGLPPIHADPLSELANKDYNTQLPVANQPGTWN